MLVDFLLDFLGVDRLILSKDFIVVRKHHGVVGRIIQIHQLFDPFFTVEPRFLHGPEDFSFIMINLDLL